MPGQSNYVDRFVEIPIEDMSNSMRNASLSNGHVEKQQGTISHDRVCINVSGLRFETAQRTLARFPHTLLGDPGRRRLFFDPIRHEVFFDRYRDAFQAILFYYQSGGMLKRPVDVPFVVFLHELEFFDLGEEAMRAFLQDEGLSLSKDPEPPSDGWKRHLWLLMERPESSFLAYCVYLISFTLILIHNLAFVVSTLPHMRKEHPDNSTFTDAGDLPDFGYPIFIVESVCVVWFILELLFRFASIDKKIHFFGDALIWIDLAVIGSYLVHLITDLIWILGDQKHFSLEVLRFVRLLRVLRILKLARHFHGLRILGKTLQSSWRELVILLVFLFTGVVLFASAIHYTEADVRDTRLKSVPEAFWWAIVTMTTVGYGDITPITPVGKLVGALCAVFGIIVMALPVPFIVASFKLHYETFSNPGEPALLSLTIKYITSFVSSWLSTYRTS
uniref:potassium voltage-gated channel subfamily A member 2-like n=1 Tax=Myxine glutinosa TaxID=7769 RepID=UPI00358FE3F2